MTDYNLKFTEKATGKQYIGKRITSNDYVIREEESGLKISISYYRLRKNFLFDKRNKNDCRERNKKFWSRVKLSKKQAA